MQMKRNHWTQKLFFAGLLLFAGSELVMAQGQAGGSPASGAVARDNSDNGKKEYNAQKMLDSGLDLLEQGQEDRGVKVISQIAQMYPDSKAAIKAELALGNYYVEKKQYDSAIKHLLKCAKAVEAMENSDIEAESLYKLGICYFNQNQFNQAFAQLRQVVNKFPGSVFANEAYYYIGMCHFKLGRWNQAVDSLERVGTSIPPEDMANSQGKEVLGEAGQRLYVKIYDEDLIVLGLDGNSDQLKVVLTNANGDKETIIMDKLGKETVTFIGSVPTAPGVAKQENGVLETKGGDVVTITYMDTHTTSGKTDMPITAKISLVSTATVGFTTGSYEDYASVLLADQEMFMRVRDLDADITPQKDKVTVVVKSTYKVEKNPDEMENGIVFDDEEPEYKVRATKEFVLTETGDRTGIFVGSAKPYFYDPDHNLDITDNSADAPLKVQKDDIVTIEYVDKVHLDGREEVARSFKLKMVVGEIPNVAVQTQHIEDPNIKARKNLIEGKLLLRLSQIFKEMGLVDFATKRANEGLEKIEDVMRINSDAALEHSLLEDAFNTKWELLIVQDKIQEAIAVCTLLIKTFPDSVLVDRALIKIAQIKIQEGSDRSIAEGLNIYRGIIQLPKSDLKSEAQYNIAEVSELLAIKRYKERLEKDPTAKPNLGPVMAEYKKCADNYPDSPFAGKSLEKIARFYMDQKDYNRVIEMMDQIFRDYPDADFLDAMLYTWAEATFSMDRFSESIEKCEQLISEYPNSQYAGKAQDLRTLNRDRISSLSGEEGEYEE